MELEGAVQNGLVVPDDDAGLADGTRVRISPATPATAAAVATPSSGRLKT